MKKGIAAILALGLSIITLMCGSLSVLAASYVESVIAEDFSGDFDYKFLAPGDMNADGKVDADDLVNLRQLLLNNTKDSSYTAVYKANGEIARYSDINGDGFVNIKDLVRQKKNLAKYFVFISDGTMSLNGNTAFTGAFTSVLAENATYEVSITYKSDSPITVRIADLNKEIIFDAVDEVSTVTKTFETPATITDSESIDFGIIGVAFVEDISVTRIDIDNDLVDNW